MRKLEDHALYIKADSLFTRFGAEVTAFVRQFAGAALPDLLVPADGAVIAGLVIVARTAGAGQGVLGALDAGAALAILGCFAVWSWHHFCIGSPH